MSQENEKLFVVRLYDGFDHQWMDVTEPMSKEAADAEWKRLTDDGKKNSKYDHIDYYAVYPSSTKMLYSNGFGERK